MWEICGDQFWSKQIIKLQLEKKVQSVLIALLPILPPTPKKITPQKKTPKFANLLICPGAFLTFVIFNAAKEEER